MAGLALGGGAEQRGDVVLALDVGLVGEVEVAAIGLRLAGERVAQALLGLRSLQTHDDLLGDSERTRPQTASEYPTVTGRAAHGNTCLQSGALERAIPGRPGCRAEEAAPVC